MAIRYITGTSTSGNWTAATIAGTFMWNNYPTLGIPGIDSNAGTSDDVYSNAKTIFISSDINIGTGTLRNVASTPIVVGGVFSITGTNVSITANTAGGATTTLTTTGVTSTSTINYYGIINGSTTSAIYSTFIKSGVTFNYYGNTIGGAAGGGISIGSGGTLNIPNPLTVADVGGTNNMCISNSGTTYITVATINSLKNNIDNYGLMYGYNMILQSVSAPGPTTYSAIENKINGYLYVTGTTIGNSSYPFHGIENYGFLNFSGICAGGGAANGIRNRSTGTLIFTGDLSGTSTTSYFSIYDETTGTTTINLNSIFNPVYSLRSSGNAIINVIPDSLSPTGSSTSVSIGNNDGIINNAGSGSIIVSGKTFSGATSPTNTSLNRFLNNTGSGSITIYGDLYVRDVSSNWGNFNYVGGLVTNNSSSTSSVINIFGSCYGGSGGATENGICVSNKKQGTINISGDTISAGNGGGSTIPVTDGAFYGGVAISNSSDASGTGGTINITANTLSNGNGTNTICVCTNLGVVNVNCNNFYVKTGTTAHMFYTVGTSRVNVTSTIDDTLNYRDVGIVGSGGGQFLYNNGATSIINFIGGKLLSGYGSNTTIFNNLAGTINVTGTSIIGGFSNTATVNNNGTGTINISGVTLISGGSGSTTAHLLYNGNTGLLNITGSSGVNLYNAIGTSGSYMIYNVGGTPGTINISSANTISSILSSSAVVWNNSNGNINITGSSFIAGTGNTGTINNVTTGNVNLSGVNLISGGTGGSSTSYLLNNGGAGSISVTGSNVTMYGSVGTVNHTVYNAAGGRISVSTATTIITTASTGVAHAVYNNSTGTINITGITFNNQNKSTTNTFYNNSTGTITINANNILNSNIYGNHTIYNFAAGTINISATTISASSLFNIFPIYSITNGTLNITADTISSSNVSPAIYSIGSTSRTNVTFGNLVFNNGISPIYNTSTISSTMVTNTSQDSIIVMEDINNNYVEFATSGFTGNNSAILPSSGNVRSNLVYGYSAATTSLTGSTIIPQPSEVTYGTLYDATTTGTTPVLSVYQFGESLTTSGQTV